MKMILSDQKKRRSAAFGLICLIVISPTSAHSDSLKLRGVLENIEDATDLDIFYKSITNTGIGDRNIDLKLIELGFKCVRTKSSIIVFNCLYLKCSKQFLRNRLFSISFVMNKRNGLYKRIFRHLTSCIDDRQWLDKKQSELLGGQ